MPPSPHRHQPLTLEEQAVLAASATGLAPREIAKRLGYSSEEIRRHLRSAIAKLGARSKLEAVVIALREGLINLPEHHA
jgi:DNA-binding CsgD family transcriptional regulator